ncbi:MAG: hypothetical protein ACKVJ6_09220, partial [Flavobacteriales bacterium]
MKRLILFTFLVIFSNSLLSQTITVLDPNGGEQISGCTNYTISWNSSGTSTYFNVDYSTDGGNTWSSIASSYQSNSLVWSVPYIYSTTCLLKVYDANDFSIFDESDFYFSIIAPIQVISPNGGELFTTYQSYPIYYSALGQVGNVNLYYSLDNGLNWTTITTNHNGGSYNWTIPNLPTEYALIKVQDPSNTCITDLSDTVFTILSEVEVISPNGGEQIQAEVGVPFGTAEYYMDNVPVVTDGGYFYDSGGPTSGYGNNENYYKTFYPETPGNKIRITCYYKDLYNNDDKIEIWNKPSASGSSNWNYPGNNTFSVTSSHATGALTVRFYSDNWNTGNGFEAYIESVGQPTHTIDWSIIGTSKYFNLSYSVDNGLTWSKIASKYYTTTGDYDWNVPNNASTNCLVKVEDWENGDVVDISDNVFEILEAQSHITVIRPNVNDNYPAGVSNQIEWSSFEVSSSFNVEYSYDNGNTWNFIDNTSSSNGITGDFNFSTYGSYNWTVPNTPSDSCYVRVLDATNSTIYDISDRFIISPQAPAITLTSPNGGENLDGCISKDITWLINNNAIEGAPSGSYDVYVSFDNMTTWSNLVMGDGGNGWNWPELPNIDYPLCWIKVIDSNDSTKYDISDSAFMIVKTTDVVLVTPNSGEQWIAYEDENIEYVKTSNANNVNLYYSLDNGLNWTTITTNHDGGTYNWTIPNLPSEDALIKVQDMYTSCRSDLSDTVFTILSEVEVISP